MITKYTDSFSLFCKTNSVYSRYFSCSIDKLTEFRDVASQFLDGPFSILLQGDAGRGKTYFLISLIHELLHSKELPLHMMRFINAHDLQEKVEIDFKDKGSARSFLGSLKDIYYLFIDDFGVEKSRQIGERNYYSILDRRLGKDLPTVISTNLTNDEILTNYGTRIYSRLHEFSRINFKGPDLRQFPVQKEQEDEDKYIYNMENLK